MKIQTKKAASIILGLYLILIFFAAPLNILAADPASETPVKSINDVFRILTSIVKWMYTIFFIVAAIFIIIAAFTYLTAQGNPEKIQSANKQILYAVVAIIVALLSVSFTVIIKRFLSTGN